MDFSNSVLLLFSLLCCEVVVCRMPIQEVLLNVAGWIVSHVSLIDVSFVFS